MVDADDRELVQRAAEGDTAAFDRLISLHGAAVQRFLEVIGAREVEDALQETFIAAWRSARHYAGRGAVLSWLLSIARNVHRHQRRKRVEEPTTDVALEVLAADAGWGCGADEQRELDARLDRDLLMRAMERLPDDEREVLVLRELEQLSGEETAALLQITTAAMKSRLHRARIHLAALVRRQGNDQTLRRDHASA